MFKLKKHFSKCFYIFLWLLVLSELWSDGTRGRLIDMKLINTWKPWNKSVPTRFSPTFYEFHPSQHSSSLENELAPEGPKKIFDKHLEILNISFNPETRDGFEMNSGIPNPGIFGHSGWNNIFKCVHTFSASEKATYLDIDCSANKKDSGVIRRRRFVAVKSIKLWEKIRLSKLKLKFSINTVIFSIL